MTSHRNNPIHISVAAMSRKPKITGGIRKSVAVQRKGLAPKSGHRHPKTTRYNRKYKFNGVKKVTKKGGPGTSNNSRALFHGGPSGFGH